MPANHDVFNQPPVLAGYDVAADEALLDAVHREGAGWGAGRHPRTRPPGRVGPGGREWGRQANEHPPVLRTHDRFGHRIDEVGFHPAWHELMTVAVRHGLHATPSRRAPRPGAHVARAAGFYVWGTADAGHCCPISMTYAIVPALRHRELAGRFEPLLAAPEYDFGLRPPGSKRGLLAGMSMTEKQGGSDVRANTTRAVLAGDGSYVLTGHKWFTSAPMGDLFMVLAQAPGGLSCFLLAGCAGRQPERHAPAAPEGQARQPVERVGRGRVRRGGRLAGRRGGPWGPHHHRDGEHHPAGLRARHGDRDADRRHARGAPCRAPDGLRPEAGRPAADGQRAGGPGDRVRGNHAGGAPARRGNNGMQARGDEQEAAFRRLALAATKYWACKRAPMHAAEALECLGGNGYVEESGMPRLYREAPLSSIWEGSGNVAALDALRALTRQPETAELRLLRRTRPGGGSRPPPGSGDRPAAQGSQ